MTRENVGKHGELGFRHGRKCRLSLLPCGDVSLDDQNVMPEQERNIMSECCV